MRNELLLPTLGLRGVNACGGSVRPVRAKARRATPVEAGTSHL